MSASLPSREASVKSTSSGSPTRGGLLLQRKCACGASASALTEECPECKGKARLQAKLTVGASNDPLELEADRIADRVLAKPADIGVSEAPLHIQRFPRQAIGQAGTAPASVDRALASPGSPLEPALRHDMEQRFGHDFSRVRVHSGLEPEASARQVDALAYTCGHDIVFGANRFAPATIEGRRLLAHELTHVVQQTGLDGSDRATSIQRDVAATGGFLAPKDLVDKFEDAIDQKFFGKLAEVVREALYSHPKPYRYVREVIKAIGSDDEDQLGAALISLLPESKLDQMAASSDGRATMNILYTAIITGKVSEFERRQANRILMAKLRRKSPENYMKGMTWRPNGAVTPIFPVRFMRVTPTDYAPPLAKLTSEGKIVVTYPSRVSTMPTFKEEVATLGNVFGAGMVLDPNEIVGIKDYETGGKVFYLPALALIDYSNQAIQSTSGKIIEVSIIAATMGIGAGAAASRAAASEMVTSTAIWGARLARTAHVLDRAASVIEIAAFVINENRDWILSSLGKPGKLLVRFSDMASSAAAIYGLGRLGQGGYQIVKGMQTAASEARTLGKGLTRERAKVLDRLDEETDSMLRELDEAQAAKGAAPTDATQSPGPTGRVDDSAAAKPPAKPAPKPAGAVDELDAAASKIGITRQKLHHEVEDLRGQTVDPDNVRQPKDNTALDADMDAQGHNFTRDRASRTWCRRSDEACVLDLGKGLNKDVDGAIAKKQSKFERIEQERKAREAAPPRKRVPKRDPDVQADPKAARVAARARQEAARTSTTKAIKRQIERAESLEIRLKVEIGQSEQRLKRLTDPAKRTAETAKKQELAKELNSAIEARTALREKLDEIAITPYDRARAFSYSDAAEKEVIDRARRTVDAPGGQKKIETVDEMSGKPVKEPSIDHVVPIEVIVQMDGWSKLRPHQQREILSRTDNLRMMERRFNSSKGMKRWADWPAGRRHYGEDAWARMVQTERELRAAIQSRINEMLAGSSESMRALP